jgi:putative ABC transport system permease protein
MSWVHAVRHKLRILLRPGAYQRELDAEMRFHLDLDAMQQRDEGDARRRFGNRTYYQEETRRMTWLGTLDVLRQDFGYAWRGVVRSPGLTAVIVGTLALGIGANAAIFTLVDRLYLRAPEGIHDPASLRRLWIEHFGTSSVMAETAGGRAESMTSETINWPIYGAIVEASGEPSSMALYRTDFALRMGRSRSAPRVRGVYATASYFEVLGVQPVLGRLYTADEDRVGGDARVAVVSHAFWRDHLGEDPASLGDTIDVERDRYIVIGVLPPEFTGLDLRASDVWMPLGSMPNPPWLARPWWQAANFYQFRAVRRLSPEANERAFELRAAQLVRNINRETWPGRPDTIMNVYAGSIIEARGPGRPGQDLLISSRLAGVAVMVLLIACANVINLVLARAMRRRREIAVRLALGVSRSRLVRLLTIETLLPALAAAAAALMVAGWGGSLLRGLLWPEFEWSTPVLDSRVAAFTLAIALVAGLVAGIVPAIQASNPALARALKVGAREGVSQRSRLRSSLVVVQAALSVVLLVGATLFVRSLQQVQAIDIGFDSRRLVFGRVEFEDDQVPAPPVLSATMREVVQRLEGRPGVEIVGRAGIEPMLGVAFVPFFWGADSSRSLGANTPTMSAVSPNFFRAAGVDLLRGDGFSGGDTDASPAEVVVNDALAKVLWPSVDAIGQCMRFVKRENPCYTVVGVVENVRQSSVIELKAAPQFYLPLGKLPTPGITGRTIVMRAHAEGASVATTELQSALRRAFPTAAEVSVVPMTRNLEPEYRPWRLGATLFTAFGLLALVVALVGIYSTVSYGVTQRTHEFGVRMALGARRGDVLRQVVGEGFRTVAIGVALGVVFALAAGRLIASLLYGVEPSDPMALAFVTVTLLVAAALAALLPARRATSVDPVTALRVE